MKESAVFAIALPFFYHGLAQNAVYLKNSHQKKKKKIQMDS